MDVFPSLQDAFVVFIKICCLILTLKICKRRDKLYNLTRFTSMIAPA